MPAVKKSQLTLKQKKELNKAYFNASNPASYGGIKRLVNATQIHPKLVQNWLNDQWSYALHKPVRKKFPRRKYVVRGLNHQWQMDLMDMQKYAKDNSGYRYILLAIDIFSRQAYAVAVKSKHGQEVAKALESILENVHPKLIQCDRGLEFYNAHVGAVMAKYNIEMFSIHSENKASLAERAIRTIKERLFRIFTHQSSYRWVDVLSDVIVAYNNSYHRGLKHIPSLVTKRNEVDIWIKQYSNLVKDVENTKFKVGDRVRISKNKGLFSKGYLQNWTDEVFTISRVNTKYKPAMYNLNDYNGESIEGSFYENELSKTTIKEYRIEKILRTKTVNNKKLALVKWLGYREPSWIDYNSVHGLNDK